jgi:ArsR family metal-binding transcriptional regulator
METVQNEIDRLIEEQIITCPLISTQNEFRDLKTETVVKIVKCYSDGKVTLHSIKSDAEAYAKRNEEILNQAKERIDKCFEESNFSEKIKCAVDAVNHVQAIAKKIENSIKGSYTCINNELASGQEKIKKILDEIKGCIENPPEDPSADPSVQE